MPPSNLKELVLSVSFYVFNPIFSILFGIAFIVFIWGVIEYFLEHDSEEAHTKGKHHMMWGIIGMFIMFAAFALVRVITNSIGADVPLQEFGS